MEKLQAAPDHWRSVAGWSLQSRYKMQRTQLGFCSSPENEAKIRREHSHESKDRKWQMKVGNLVKLQWDYWCWDAQTAALVGRVVLLKSPQSRNCYTVPSDQGFCILLPQKELHPRWNYSPGGVPTPPLRKSEQGSIHGGHFHWGEFSLVCCSYPAAEGFHQWSCWYWDQGRVNTYGCSHGRWSWPASRRVHSLRGSRTGLHNCWWSSKKLPPTGNEKVNQTCPMAGDAEKTPEDCFGTAEDDEAKKKRRGEENTAREYQEHGNFLELWTVEDLSRWPYE